MTIVKLTAQELHYLRYLISVHAGTEENITRAEEKAIDSLYKKLGVQ